MRPYTPERCHEFWRDYVPGPAMWEGEYAYSADWVNLYYKNKVRDESRRCFAVCQEGKAVAEIQLQCIDFESLGLSAVYADCLHRNVRSRHVLEKVGFAFLREDGLLLYFILRRGALL